MSAETPSPPVRRDHRQTVKYILTESCQAVCLRDNVLHGPRMGKMSQQANQMSGGAQPTQHSDEGEASNPLENTQFRRLWLASTVSNIGGWMQDYSRHLADDRHHNVSIARRTHADGCKPSSGILGAIGGSNRG